MSRNARSSSRSSCVAVLAILLLGPALALAAPSVELVIMEPGADVFAAFGHAALRVTDGKFDRVYNFGATDFHNQVQLVWDFLRGKSRFYLSTSSFARTLRIYGRDDRSVYRFPLLLDSRQLTALAALLADAEEHNTPYVYDHFQRNCATELRDRIDQVLGGRLHRSLLLQQTRFSFRDLAREGLANHWPLQLVGEILMGRDADRNVSAWDAGFLPRLLATNLRLESRSLIAPIQIAYLGQKVVVESEGSLTSQRILWALTGLYLLLAAAFFLAARVGRRAGWFLLAPILINGLLGLLVWFVVAVTSAPLLRFNELALVFWPLDLWLVVVLLRRPRVVFRLGKWSRGYLVLRCASLLIVVFGHLVGFLEQEPRVMILLALAPLLSIIVTHGASRGIAQRAAGISPEETA